MSTPVNPVLTNRTFLDALTEAAWGDGGTGTSVLYPILDGDYSVAIEDTSRMQDHVVGDADAQYPVLTGRRLAGELKIGAWPHIWNSVLGYAIDRDVNNEVASKTFRYTVPGVETVEHLGVKCDRIVIEGSEDGDMTLTLSLVGWYERQRSAGLLAYPAAYVVPGYAALTYRSVAVIASLDAGTTFANRIKPKGVTSFTLTLENQLKPQRMVEDRIAVEKDGTVEGVVTGARKLSFRWVGTFDRDDFSTMQRGRKRTQLKILGAHPSYTTYATLTADAGAGNAVNVVVDSSAGFAVGDVILFDAATTGVAHLPCVATVTDIPDATHITVDTLDEPVKSGDHVFNGAIEVKTERAVVPSMPKGKPFGSFVTAEVNAEVFSGGPAPLTYKCKNMAVPAGP